MTLTELARNALSAQAAVSYGPGTFPEREQKFFAARDALIGAAERVDGLTFARSTDHHKFRAAIEGPKE